MYIWLDRTLEIAGMNNSDCERLMGTDKKRSVLFEPGSIMKLRD